MKVMFVLLLFLSQLFATQAQVTFQKYPVPTHANNDNYRLVIDYYSDQQVLFPIKKADTVYVKSVASGNFSALTVWGLYITAFYANNGDLYLVKNSDTSGYQPRLYKSVNNGTSFTEISGVAGRVFRRDQYGNLFYSIPGGFAFSSDNGTNFISVSTPDTVYTACKSSSGTLFFIADSLNLYRSVDNGSNWQNISKTSTWNYAFNERSLWEMNDTLYFQSSNHLNYTTENASMWTGQVISGNISIITNAYISPDQACYITSPYGFITSNTPSSKTQWVPLAPFIGGTPNSNIYNHFIAISDSTMYFFDDTTYLYAPRTPNFVGIGENESDLKAISVYPNPADDQFILNTGEINREFRLYNLQGQLVLSEWINSSQKSIDIHRMAPGMYIWRMNTFQGKLMVR